MKVVCNLFIINATNDSALKGIFKAIKIATTLLKDVFILFFLISQISKQLSLVFIFLAVCYITLVIYYSRFMSYQALQSQIMTLATWDPKSQYISKNLQLKNKPLRKNCWQRFTAVFKPSNSKSVAAAFADLYASSQKYSAELASDQNTLMALKNITVSVYSLLVQGSGGNKIKKTKVRRKLATTCQKLNSYCKLNICHSNNVAPPIVNNFKSLSQYVKQTPTKRQNIQQAQNYLETIANHLNKLSIQLSKHKPKHVKLANEILISSKLLKKKFLSKSAAMNSQQKKFRHSYLTLQSLILKQIFQKKINYQTKELRALFNQYKLHSKNQEIEKFLTRCAKKNKKGKPYSLPVWYHFTRTASNVASILKSNEILYSHKGAYPGAFVSTKPETTYGSYGFCFSRQINKFAFKKEQGTITGPIISTLVLDSSFPIYLGKKPPLNPPNLPIAQTWFSTTPQLWAGFKNNITFRKPNKGKDPISYYRDIRLSMFSYKKTFYTSSNQGLKYLKQKKVQLMEVTDLNELMNLIHHTVNFHLKEEWQNSEVCTYPFKLLGSPNVISN